MRRRRPKNEKDEKASERRPGLARWFLKGRRVQPSVAARSREMPRTHEYNKPRKKPDMYKKPRHWPGTACVHVAACAGPLLAHASLGVSKRSTLIR